MFAQIVEYVLRPCIARLFALHLCHYRHLPLESATGDPVAKKNTAQEAVPLRYLLEGVHHVSALSLIRLFDMILPRPGTSFPCLILPPLMQKT